MSTVSKCILRQSKASNDKTIANGGNSFDKFIFRKTVLNKQSRNLNYLNLSHSTPKMSLPYRIDLKARW